MSKNLVITMSDKNYFPNGGLFIKTRKRVDADFVLYTPNGNRLDYSQKQKCNQNNIVVKEIIQMSWDTTMQTMKFFFLLWEREEYDNITFCDFDTFFINDWHEEVFKHDFTLGITTTQGFSQWKHLRSKANGGVIFYKTYRKIIDGYFKYKDSDTAHNWYEESSEFISFIIKTINHGKNVLLPEYDEIWKTLEDSPSPKHNRHRRTNQAWWCDQVALSALVLSNHQFPVEHFPCKKFNVLESKPDISVEPNIYIKHLKANKPVNITGG